MKKIVPIIVILALLLASCSSLTGSKDNLSDEEMATRVAQLLATMTTPTTEIEFPATPTPLPTSMLMTATPMATNTSVVMITATPVVEMGTESATEAATDAETATPTTEATVAAATPTVTATASSSDPATKLGMPTGIDSMDGSSTWTWPTGNDDYIDLEFNSGYMEMTGLTTLAGWRLPLINQQTDSYIELTANSGSCKGKDSYGIIFRVPVFKEPNQGYLFEVTCDGYYRLWKWDGKVGTKGLATSLVPWAQSSLINAGADKTNRLGVMAKGNTLSLYMNGVALASVSDSSFSAGFFGAFVRSAETASYKVKFDSMQYWENP
jgi:hypothetical protein